MTLDDLKARLDAFSPTQIKFVARVVDSLSRPPNADIREHGTWLTSCNEWIEYFSLALSVHHSATIEPLGLVGFESVFRNACQHVGWHVDPPGARTRRFVDLVIRAGADPERRLSLKSTAAKNLAENSAHISKLTEAAWVQDARKATTRQDEMRKLFRQYQEAVTAIIMLRAFRRANDAIPHRYQLLEIPTEIFDPIREAPSEMFQRDAPTIPCNIDGKLAAVVVVDGSDAKITIRGIQLSACTVHTEWRLE